VVRIEGVEMAVRIADVKRGEYPVICRLVVDVPAAELKSQRTMGDKVRKIREITRELREQLSAAPYVYWADDLPGWDARGEGRIEGIENGGRFSPVARTETLEVQFDKTLEPIREDEREKTTRLIAEIIASFDPGWKNRAW
jgi:hypothetical protein